MFTKVEIRNSSGSLLTLQLGDTSSGYQVQEFTGLDPVNATIASSPFANQDGAVFQSARRDMRNITAKIGIDPDPSVGTVRSLRQALYSYFMPKSFVTMKFFVDDTDDSTEDGYQIVGVVEKCEAAMFVQEPVVNLSIMCPDPDFIDPIPVSVTGLLTTDAAPGTHIPYVGSSPTGITITVNVNRTMGGFTVYYVDGAGVTWSMDVEMPGNFLAGDVVTINTVRGAKSATMVRSGTSSSVLYAISPQSTWMQLAPGDNWLRVYATGAAVPATLAYTKRFGGL